ncbi:hypothetical protein B0I35DRAFT_358276 [Stachybotrys elegans]|uniref:LysM domain-containing protein n=1 Tax=Stachybotrys elegans TaxID=80388 RepID=A0A8K0SQ08_9HYPO|nr:hypothetical protein B0I35DRAFT_358276 [Stachybotrys elegans]
MVSISLLGLIVASLPWSLAAATRNNGTISIGADARLRGARPVFPFDPNTTPYCSWWLDNTGTQACQEIPDWWAITMEDFLRWNPSISPSCGNLVAGRSYCVEVTGEPPTATSTQASVATTKATTTTAGNGIATPDPVQPGIPSNCNAFHKIKSGNSCGAIASTYGITTAKLIDWNPEVGSNCQFLWVDYHICVGVVGEKPPTPSTTAPSNGVATPKPVQPGIVGNCNAFHKVKSGDTCDGIASTYGVTKALLNQWNSEIGSACQFIWVDYYICVGTIGTSPRPTTTTTQAGNGIATPTPIQPGMVSNCDAFHKVKSGDTCDGIASTYGVTSAQLNQWNPEIGSACQYIWVDYHICVSIVGVDPKPTTTHPGNGIATPTPTQAGMTSNCRSFYFVRSGDTCAAIARAAGISEATFLSWNLGVGSSCQFLWLDTWYCVGV